jgi:UDP-N-acetylmuramate--alanine ligase
VQALWRELGASVAAATPTVYLPHRREVVDYLTSTIEPGDLVVTMGCGDVWMLGDAVRARIEETG